MSGPFTGNIKNVNDLIEDLMETYERAGAEMIPESIVVNKTRVVDSIMKTAAVQIKYDPNAEIEFFNTKSKKEIESKARSVKKITSTKGKNE